MSTYPPSSIDLKIVVLGPAGVGKTCVIHRFCNGTFLNSTLPTIGAGFFPHTMQVDETEVNIMLWDTAGEERFRSVAPSLLRGANGLILVFDLSSSSSFPDVEIYLNMFLDTTEYDCDKDLPVLLVGNKCDLERDISDETINEWAQEHKVKNIAYVSAKTGEGIDDAIQNFIKEFLKTPVQNDAPPISINVKNEPAPQEKKKCC